MNPYSLKDKTFLITGASGGIGRACAIAASYLDAKVIITGRNENRLNETFTLLNGNNHQKFTTDLATEEGISSIVNGISNIDGIVHSSGIVKANPVRFIREEEMNEIFQVNYQSPVMLTNDLLKQKKINKSGSIVFISSISSHFAYKGGALYTGSKAALNAFSKVLALELSQQKIRSNVILSAMVRTNIFSQAEQAISKELMEEHGKQYPLGFGEPEDIANAVTFLLSNASRWITGTEIVMDGGLTAGT
jgi:NAD(P)-dependent dehydrogenase (short-subunit alcohol dehydrogenase family)